MLTREGYARLDDQNSSNCEISGSFDGISVLPTTLYPSLDRYDRYRKNSFYRGGAPLPSFFSFLFTALASSSGPLDFPQDIDNLQDTSTNDLLDCNRSDVGCIARHSSSFRRTETTPMGFSLSRTLEDCTRVASQLRGLRCTELPW